MHVPKVKEGIKEERKYGLFQMLPTFPLIQSVK